jgi:hypothetical protein
MNTKAYAANAATSSGRIVAGTVIATLLMNALPNPSARKGGSICGHGEAVERISLTEDGPPTRSFGGVDTSERTQQRANRR